MLEYKKMTTTFPPPDRYVSTGLPVRRFTVEEYHRLIKEGFFADDERFELLEGLIVEKMPRDPVHDAAVEIALALLLPACPGGGACGRNAQRRQLTANLSPTSPSSVGTRETT